MYPNAQLQTDQSPPCSANAIDACLSTVLEYYYLQFTHAILGPSPLSCVVEDSLFMIAQVLQFKEPASVIRRNQPSQHQTWVLRCRPPSRSRKPRRAGLVIITTLHLSIMLASPSPLFLSTCRAANFTSFSLAFSFSSGSGLFRLAFLPLLWPWHLRISGPLVENSHTFPIESRLPGCGRVLRFQGMLGAPRCFEVATTFARRAHKYAKSSCT
jgi:hypothetical protein